MIGTSQNRGRITRTGFELVLDDRNKDDPFKMDHRSIKRATRRAQPVDHCSTAQAAQMHKREASRQSSLRAAMSEQLERLVENLSLPVPELSN